ncbi:MULTISPECIES: methylmalonyl Co-A mutase-associated GTPase MeaB [Bacillaceae]|uniref:methylmalonyl Co-A mutase-associated GTPase MeaB n=1 Tax=Bacillaceae TaxID=186817 RepID=UPI000C775B99|nr:MULTISPECIES: methylmalonyl Co-A mutase-associated GTPase MeaB [Bacillaceae]PLR68052.1 methylmalonyl Co-A mutase-associated GTPase MeaB [Bacillus sp. UMB0893]QNG61297.1 methylmalonyl Co-A mutase-associated GTPase MeaB [Bacillus sp. PAMC26568]
MTDKRQKRKKTGSVEKSAEDYIKGVLKGERVAVAQAITLVESNAEKHFEKAQQMIEVLLQKGHPSIRIGITGVPGAGKSTFIDAFGTYLCSLGHKVAVLAVDPSSQVSKGSILGDKTRMERLSRNPDAFIRPSPSSGTLGGVTRKTRESIIVCEASGYDVILVETVGVGQGEFAIRGMVDFFLLLVLTGAGDELQTMKKGIMELPDLVVVNKADGENLENAKKAMHEYNHILHFLKSYTPGWETKAATASALHETGIHEIWETITVFSKETRENGIFEERRKLQQKEWLYDMIQEQLKHHFFQHSYIKGNMLKYEREVTEGKRPVSSSVKELISAFLNGENNG